MNLIRLLFFFKGDKKRGEFIKKSYIYKVLSGIVGT